MLRTLMVSLVLTPSLWEQTIRLYIMIPFSFLAPVDKMQCLTCLQTNASLYSQYYSTVPRLSLHSQYYSTVPRLSLYSQYYSTVPRLSLYSQYYSTVPRLSLHSQYYSTVPRFFSS